MVLERRRAYYIRRICELCIHTSLAVGVSVIKTKANKDPRYFVWMGREDMTVDLSTFVHSE